MSRARSALGRPTELARYALAGAIAALPLLLVVATLAELGHPGSARAVAALACLVSLLPIGLGGRVLLSLRAELAVPGRARLERSELPHRAWAAVLLGVAVLGLVPALLSAS